MTADGGDAMAEQVKTEADESTNGGYLDFDLLIEKTAEGHRARVLSSPAGQAQHDFVIPVDPKDSQILMLQFGQARNTRRAPMHFRRKAIEFGSQLYQAVFGGEVRLAYRQSCDEANRQGLGLRLRLRLDDVELESLPWEFLHSDYVDDFLVLSRHTPLVRFVEMRSLGNAPQITLPLRILVMISNATDFGTLDTEAEWQRLQSAMKQRIDRGEVELIRVPKGSLAELRRTLQTGEFHIFHFIGHAAYDETFDDGVLIMEKSDGTGEVVPGRNLGTILGDQKSLRLVVLNACEGARTSSDDRFSGVAQSLIRRQLPAVIAMQFEITDEAAITLSRDFYGALVAGLPVDAALSEARRGLFSVGNQVEWATPVLYQRSGSGKIFDIDDAAPLHLECDVIIELDDGGPGTGPSTTSDLDGGPADSEPLVIDLRTPSEPVAATAEPVATPEPATAAAEPALATPAPTAHEAATSVATIAPDDAPAVVDPDEVEVSQWLKSAPAKVLLVGAVVVVAMAAIVIGQLMNRTTETAASIDTSADVDVDASPAPEPTVRQATSVVPTTSVRETVPLPEPTVRQDASEVATTPAQETVPLPEPTEAAIPVPAFVPDDTGMDRYPWQFGSLLVTLADTVEIPLRFPLIDAADGGRWADEWFLDVVDASPTYFEVEVAAVEDCNFAGACHIGSFGGGQLEAFGVPTGGEIVYLDNGQIAMWFDFECGASCGDGVIRWLEGNTMYWVALKAGSRQNVLELANAATDPRAPHVISGTVTPQRMQDRLVTIDGLATEWNGVTRHLATLPIYENGWDGVPDGYGQFAFGRDESNLYVFADVIDETYDQVNRGVSAFAGDGVNISIGQCCEQTTPGPADFQLTVSALNDGTTTGAIYFGDNSRSTFFPDARELPDDIDVAFRRTGVGYDIEIALPLDYLGDSPLSILASVNDSDGRNQQTSIFAHLENPFGVASDFRNNEVIEAGQSVFSNPSAWGRLVD